MSWKLKKEPEKNRIVVTVTGDELVSIIPEELIELVEENADIGDGCIEEAINRLEKGIFEFYLSIPDTQVEGF